MVRIDRKVYVRAAPLYAPAASAHTTSDAATKAGRFYLDYFDYHTRERFSTEDLRRIRSMLVLFTINNVIDQ